MSILRSSCSFVKTFAVSAGVAVGVEEEIASLFSPVRAYIWSADPLNSVGQSGVIQLGYWAFAMVMWLSVTGILVAGSIALFRRYRMTDR